MFWGLILEPQRRYSQVVKKPFRITMAALDVNSSNEDPAQVMVTFQNRNFLICTLQKGKILNEHLDLCFEVPLNATMTLFSFDRAIQEILLVQEGDQISFAANGSCHVHLTGYLMDTEDSAEAEDGEESDQEFEDEIEKDSEGKKRCGDDKNLPPTKKSKVLEMLEDAVNNEEDDSDFSLTNIAATSSDEEESDSGEEEEVDEEEDGDEDKDGEVDEDGDDDDDEDDEEEDEDDEVDEEEEIKPEVKSPKKQLRNVKQPQNIKQQQKGTMKTNSVTESIKSDKNKKAEKEKMQENASPQKNGSPPKQRIVEGGVGIEELKVGNGPVAKPGKFVQVYYEGRLKSNNKLFDSATKGSGFEFRLGRQEVIKGWDVGVAGMKVGGKRRITCPPNMAYVAKGLPPAIPPKSTLVFEVELKKVK